MLSIQQWAKKTLRFFGDDIWRLQIDNPKSVRAYALRYLRVFTYAARGYHQDKCYLRASALTFYSLLSFVPVVAMAFAVAKGFGFRKLLETSLLEKFPGNEEVLQQVITSADSFLESAKGGLIAGVGVALLFWSIVKVLGHIEGSFNHIWHIRQARKLSRKFSDYLSMMMVGPVLFIMSSSFAIYLTTQIRLITEKISLLGMVAPLIFSALDFSPYVIIWTLFTFMYIFMPNTQVRFPSALLAGVVAGTAFQLVQYGYLHFQVGVAQYNAIYGSFAALPLFFVWMQISWLVVLFGAELSHAHQRVASNDIDPPGPGISFAQKRLAALQIAHVIVKRFEHGEPPIITDDIAIALKIPLASVEKVVAMLREARLVSAVQMNGEQTTGYQPGQDIGSLTVHGIIRALDNLGASFAQAPQTSEYRKLAQTIASLDEIIKNAPANKPLKDI